jgi:DNA-binding protein
VTAVLCIINNKNIKLTTENSQSKTEHQSVSKIEAGLEEA